MINFQRDEISCTAPIARIKVIGIGGAGGNTVNSMINTGLENVEFLVANTDAQALYLSKAPLKIQLGAKSTKGLGSGSNPEIGKRAAEEDLEKIEEYLDDSDVIFLSAGLGGGTGSGALPVIARAAKERNILSIAVVTKPFTFEGKRRAAIAQEALEALKKEVDTLIVIPNQKLLEVADQNVSLVNAFGMINEVIVQFVRSISTIITQAGHINVDFADVKSIMKGMGIAIMGTGRASGPGRAERAALDAISSPLLENVDIKGARGVLLNITGNAHLGLHEVSAAASLIYEAAHENANIVLGSVIDEAMGDEVSVTIIATGFFPEKDSSSDLMQPARTDIELKKATSSAHMLTEEPKAEHIISQEKLSDQSIYHFSSFDKDNLEIPTVLRRLAKEINSEK